MKPARIAKLCLLFVAVSLLTRAYMLPVEVIDIDESQYAAGSWVVLDGGLLYTDYVDNKPPLLYVYYAVAQLLLGRGLVAVHLVTILVTIPLTALACAAFFDFDRRGAVAGLLFLIYSAAFLAHDMHASNAELLMILPGSWALVLVRSEERARRPALLFAAGFLVGAGVLLKYQVAAWLPAIACACIYDCIRRKQLVAWIPLLLAAGAGLALPLFGAWAWFETHGGAGPMLYWTIRNNFAYAANPITLHEAVGRLAAGVLPFALVTAPLWWFSAGIRHGDEPRYRQVLVLSTLVLSAAAAFLGFRFFPHYFIQLYVPLCLGAAPGIAALLEPMGRKARVFIAYTAGVWLLFAAINIALYHPDVRVYRERSPVFEQVADRLRNDPCYSGGSIFVWGYTPLYYYAGLRPASRFAVLPQSGLTGYVSGNLESVNSMQFVRQEHWKILIADLEKNRATFIVDTSPARIYRWDRYPVRDFPLLQKYLQDHYEPFDTVDDIVLYRRLGCR